MESTGTRHLVPFMSQREVSSLITQWSLGGNDAQGATGACNWKRGTIIEVKKCLISSLCLIHLSHFTPLRAILILSFWSSNPFKLPT